MKVIQAYVYDELPSLPYYSSPKGLRKRLRWTPSENNESASQPFIGSKLNDKFLFVLSR